MTLTLTLKTIIWLVDLVSFFHFSVQSLPSLPWDAVHHVIVLVRPDRTEINTPRKYLSNLKFLMSKYAVISVGTVFRAQYSLAGHYFISWPFADVLLGWVVSRHSTTVGATAAGDLNYSNGLFRHRAPCRVTAAVAWDLSPSCTVSGHCCCSMGPFAIVHRVGSLLLLQWDLSPSCTVSGHCCCSNGTFLRRLESRQEHKKKLWIFPSKKCCADSLSVYPTPVCIRTQKNDHVCTLKIL